MRTFTVRVTIEAAFARDVHHALDVVEACLTKVSGRIVRAEIGEPATRRMRARTSGD